MSNKDDAEIIKLILDGDQDSYRILVDKYSNMIFMHIFKICANREDAQEITQDSFVKAYFSLKKFKGKSSFSTWLYRIAYNTTISTLRKKKRLTFTEDIDKYISYSSNKKWSSNTNNEINEKIIDETHYKQIELAMLSLKIEDRFVLTAFYQEHKSIAEIAEISGQNLSNVKTRLHRSRKRLTEVIKNNR
ncbi:MAG: RNA polymerase sigma factor [Bacteroidales bacterium]